MSGEAAFERRHIGPDATQLASMLATVGAPSLDALIDEAVPARIRTSRPLDLPPPISEHEALAALAERAAQNVVLRSFLGMGYHGTITPPVIQRNVLENPGWYTAYTPYQAEISQGRLEALLVFQTVVQELTGLEIANASMLDEATAAAEAMTMSHRVSRSKSERFFVDEA
ncbi:MAG: glycine dehydrogenase (aminomethyl-transferring), partial [Phycisphaerales bacterium]|nr:glycine dehydrogenase (aminomethyl-transferring) [Phycisphaerales bacterium]